VHAKVTGPPAAVDVVIFRDQDKSRGDMRRTLVEVEQIYISVSKEEKLTCCPAGFCEGACQEHTVATRCRMRASTASSVSGSDEASSFFVVGDSTAVRAAGEPEGRGALKPPCTYANCSLKSSAKLGLALH